MKKCPFHIYWGQKNGVLVTRDGEEGTKPEVVLANNRISLDQVKATVALVVAGLLIFWRVSRAIAKHRRRREARAAKSED